MTGVPYLAEEIMELQLLDRYDDAQLLLDGATNDSGGKAGAILPDLLFAQLKQHYNLGRLREADETASMLIELGQVTGTTVHIIEGFLCARLWRCCAASPSWPRNDCDRRCASPTTTRIHHPGLAFLSGWLTTEQGDVASGQLSLAALLESPADAQLLGVVALLCNGSIQHRINQRRNRYHRAHSRINGGRCTAQSRRPHAQRSGVESPRTARRRSWHVG